MVFREWGAVMMNNFYPSVARHRCAATAARARAGGARDGARLLQQSRLLPAARPGAGSTAWAIFAPEPSAFTNIEGYMERLAAEIEHRRGEQRPMIVCHSMGGLVARAYLCTHGAGRVKRSSPSRVLITARCTRASGGNAQQMEPDDFRRSFAAGGRQGSCVRPHLDPRRTTTGCAADTSQLALGAQHRDPGRGHVDILLRPRGDRAEGCAGRCRDARLEERQHLLGVVGHVGLRITCETRPFSSMMKVTRSAMPAALFNFDARPPPPSVPARPGAVGIREQGD